MNESSNDGRSAVYELREVKRTFRRGASEVRAVDDVNLAVFGGEFLAIQGASGSGKSTLLQLLGGLEKVSSGSLSFAGRELSKLGDKELTALRATQIGFVFQHFNLIPTLSALQNVEAALAPAGMKTSARRARAKNLLDQVGLAGRQTHLPSNLSGGEQQRVAIARALANEPRVILADEPTGNLDTSTGEEIVQLMSELSADKGVTVILATHAEYVAKRAGRALIMQDGQLSEPPKRRPRKPKAAPERS